MTDINKNKTNNELQEITLDLIKDLRRRGLGIEAHELLESFRKDVKKTGQQVKNDIIKRDRLIKKTKGLCVSISCHNNAEEGLYCKRCAESRLKYEKNRRLKYKLSKQNIDKKTDKRIISKIEYPIQPISDKKLSLEEFKNYLLDEKVHGTFIVNNRKIILCLFDSTGRKHNNEYMAKYNSINRKEINIYRKRKYYESIKNGRCPKCYTKVNGSILCKSCAERSVLNSNKKRLLIIKKRMEIEQLNLDEAIEKMRYRNKETLKRLFKKFETKIIGGKK